MTQKLTRSDKFLRKKRNSEIIEKMKKGEPLKLFDSSASWFPPRPIIEKDSKAIARLYEDKKDDLNDLNKI